MLAFLELLHNWSHSLQSAGPLILGASVHGPLRLAEAKREFSQPYPQSDVSFDGRGHGHF